MRVSRSARRPLSIGTLLAAAVLGSSIRADATPNQPHVLAAHRQSAAATEATLPTGFPGRPGGDLFHTEFDDGTLRRIQLLLRDPAADRRRHGHLVGRDRRAARDHCPAANSTYTTTFTWPRHRKTKLRLRVSDGRGGVDTVAIAIRAPTLKKLAPGRPVAKERPPPDQSGVAADCATRTHENDRGVTSRWHPSNEGSDGPSRLVSGTARPIPMLGS